MKNWKILALFLAVLMCLTACGAPQTPSKTPDAPDEPIIEIVASPEPDSGIPPAITEKEPTKEGETYQATGMYIGMADNNLLVIIEANPEDGKPEKSYQISPEIDLEAMGITDGSMVDLTYTVDINGVKRVQSISVAY